MPPRACGWRLRPEIGDRTRRNDEHAFRLAQAPDTPGFGFAGNLRLEHPALGAGERACRGDPEAALEREAELGLENVHRGARRGDLLLCHLREGCGDPHASLRHVAELHVVLIADLAHRLLEGRPPQPEQLLEIHPGKGTPADLEGLGVSTLDRLRKVFAGSKVVRIDDLLRLGHNPGREGETSQCDDETQHAARS